MEASLKKYVEESESETIEVTASYRSTLVAMFEALLRGEQDRLNEALEHRQEPREREPDPLDRTEQSTEFLILAQQITDLGESIRQKQLLINDLKGSWDLRCHCGIFLGPRLNLGVASHHCTTCQAGVERKHPGSRVHH